MRNELEGKINGDRKLISRIINNRGNLFHKGRRIFISNAFNGFNVGLDERPKERIKVWFANHYLGEIDKKTFVFTPNKELVTVGKLIKSVTHVLTSFRFLCRDNRPRQVIPSHNFFQKYPYRKCTVPHQFHS